jgi:hypothetical protein
MPQLPSFAALLKEFPKGTMEAVGALIGGTVGTQIAKYYWNSCCVRICRCLNYAGDPVPPGGGGAVNPYMEDKKVHTYEGGDGKRYIFNTYDLRAYLTVRYGAPVQFPGTKMAPDLGPIKGIIMFNYLHADLWDGTVGKCAGPHPDGYFGDQEVQRGFIWVWKTS